MRHDVYGMLMVMKSRLFNFCLGLVWMALHYREVKGIEKTLAYIIFLFVLWVHVRNVGFMQSFLIFLSWLSSQLRR
jgi:integral membrane sensor domain MASE1